MKSVCICLIFLFSTEALAAKGKPPKKGKADKTATAKPAKPQKDLDEALKLFAEARWADALARLEMMLAAIDTSTAAPDDRERQIREHQVLSLYELKREADATAAFKVLVDRFPSFEFDEDQVLPKTIGFFAQNDPRQKQKEIVVAPAPVDQAPVTPAVVVNATPPWSPAYLVPLGIGQFIAKSPVRGVLFLVLQAGLIALNIAGFVLFQDQLVGPGNQVKDQALGQLYQTLMNTGFIGWIAALALGTADGIFLESTPPGVLSKR